jgi:hypothetical protein
MWNTAYVPCRRRLGWECGRGREPALWLYCLRCHQGIATRIHQKFCDATDTLVAVVTTSPSGICT